MATGRGTGFDFTLPTSAQVCAWARNAPSRCPPTSSAPIALSGTRAGLRASRLLESVVKQPDKCPFRSNPACKLRLREQGSPMGSPKFLAAIHIAWDLEQLCDHSQELVWLSDRWLR